MKIRNALVAISFLVTGASVSNAAVFVISNVGDLLTDTLYADSAGMPMTGGVVTIGYFTSGIAQGDVDTIPELVANLGNYTIQSSAAPGSSLGTSYGDISIAGYANNSDTPTDIGQVLASASNPLIGRVVYSIFGNAATLALSTEFAMVAIGTIQDEATATATFSSNPINPAIIGTNGTWEGDIGLELGTQTYGTLQLAAIPEPSAALLGALGALGLLRRRRI